MRTRRLLALFVGGTLAVGGGVAVATEGPGPPEHAMALARGAAAEAQAVAQDLETQVEETGEPQGRGSAAFAERHAALAEAHAEHPGNAAAVHAALADGQSPAMVRGEHVPPGQAKKQETDALPPGQARKAERDALDATRDALDDDEAKAKDEDETETETEVD